MKIWAIAWKDTLIRFRDRNALLLMIAAPIIISAIMGAAFGGGDDSPTLSNIPMIVVNKDSGPLGAQFIDVLETDDLSTLLSVRLIDDLDQARQEVEAGEARAVVYIPPEFSASVMTSGGEQADQTALIQVLTDPAAQITPSIISAVVSQIGITFGNVALTREVAFDQLQPLNVEPATINTLLNNEMDTVTAPSNITVNQVIVGQTGSTNVLAFFAPSMAIFFLLFTMFDGPRSILIEQMQGTFDRLRTSPTRLGQILLGKLGGTFLTGILQFVIFVVASSFLFGIDWGDSLLGLALMVLTFIAAATSIGALITAFSRDIAQANLIGSSVVLLFGFLGGNFFQTDSLPEWIQILSRLTINRWALDGFTDLTIRNLGVEAILLEAGVLFAIAVVCFSLAVWRLPRRFTR